MIKKFLNYPFHKINLHLTFSSEFPGIKLERLKDLKKRKAIIKAKKYFGKKGYLLVKSGLLEETMLYRC